MLHLTLVIGCRGGGQYGLIHSACNRRLEARCDLAAAVTAAIGLDIHRFFPLPLSRRGRFDRLSHTVIRHVHAIAVVVPLPSQSRSTVRPTMRGAMRCRGEQASVSHRLSGECDAIEICITDQ